MKAQAAVEFISILVFLMLLISLAGYAAVSAQTTVLHEQESEEAHQIAAQVATEINLAKEIGPGYSHTFVLPALLTSGETYAIDIAHPHEVQISWANQFYTLPVLAEAMAGTLAAGTNKIRNDNGVIMFA